MQSLHAQLTIGKDGIIEKHRPGHEFHESLVQLEAAELIRSSGEVIVRIMQGNFESEEFEQKIKVH